MEQTAEDVASYLTRAVLDLTKSMGELKGDIGEMKGEMRVSIAEVKGLIGKLESSLESVKASVDTMKPQLADLVKWRHMILGAAILMGAIGSFFVAAIAKSNMGKLF